LRRSPNEAGYLRRRGWTHLEAAVWLFALAAVVVSDILLITGVVGHWAVFLGGVILLALGLMRYRAEAGQKKRNDR
jgi:Flp pilus assembly protein TadB